jgi:hypothetical protein
MFIPTRFGGPHALWRGGGPGCKKYTQSPEKTSWNEIEKIIKEKKKQKTFR